MNKLFSKKWTGLITFLVICSTAVQAQKINRQALVSRHNVKVQQVDSLASLSVGNGKFAFTVDATGLQTFPDRYQHGVPLGTQTEWGWNSFKNTENFTLEESLREYQQYGRNITYAVQVKTPERNKNASEWFRKNVHRLQLGNLGLEITLKNGKAASPEDIKNIKQELDLWTGAIKSSFTIEGEPVEVLTVSHQQDDLISTKINSKLLTTGRLKIKLRYPYPTAEWTDVGNNHASTDKHQTLLTKNSSSSAVIKHQLDSATYLTALKWSGKAGITTKENHYFVISPDIKSNTFELTAWFQEKETQKPLPSFTETATNSTNGWKTFWQSGGAVDFAGSSDPRAHELERRVILSQYLTKIQCAGSYPPQETGLTYNSWFGKPHLEMTWWHMVHFALWGRPEIMEKTADWYNKVAGGAKKLAERQGFDGLRWQKMTDNNGNESPSSVGALLIWQQPHLITFAELGYRAHPDKKTLEQYKDLVFGTADFMASFAYLDKKTGKYRLGPGVIPAQERFKAEETFNPTYELAYWHWALDIAQQWRERLGMKRSAKWDEVMAKLSTLPVQDGVYLATESAKDSYTNPEFKTDHPSVLGTYGMLPETPLLDKKIMRKTFDLVWDTWSWNDTWGWDFPMTAMSAARLNIPERAIDALLMDVQTNTYLVNGHNYQDERLRLYLPGNGGLLTAVAMMCAGWDGQTDNNPGFPKNGKWNVKWEGLKPMP
jgi:hypothetical protein